MDALNTDRTLPRDVKIHISKIIDQPLRIEYNSVFSAKGKIQEDSWTRAKETFSLEVQFERLMADQEDQRVSDVEFERNVLDLVDRNQQLLYRTSFRQRTILGILLDRGLEECATEILDKKKPGLLKKVKVGSNQISLL